MRQYSICPHIPHQQTVNITITFIIRPTITSKNVNSVILFYTSILTASPLKHKSQRKISQSFLSLAFFFKSLHGSPFAFFFFRSFVVFLLHVLFWYQLFSVPLSVSCQSLSCHAPSLLSPTPFSRCNLYSDWTLF